MSNRPHPHLEPIVKPIPADRQGAKRHYGVHPYFTRRPANVVRAYIKNFTEPGDSVLDLFGGSGVTAIEAMLLNRRGIHNDINPLANFMASQIADASHEDTRYIRVAFLEVEHSCRAEVEQITSLSENEVRLKLARANLPENIRLPKSSDVESYFELFSPRQLLALALLKQAIDMIPDKSARGALLLAWSSALAKLNKTFLSARGRIESRGGSSIFSIYRYKVAERPIELPPWHVFRERVINVIRGKEEVLKQKHLLERTDGWRGGFEHYCLDVTDLPKALGRKVDYVFTDPPYGGHIAYLDLSVLWNHWLGLEVPDWAKDREVIVGGELRHSEEHYLRRLRESIRTCLHTLKRKGWLSVVFQHWDMRYFGAILEEAAHCGGTLKAAVAQAPEVIWSMHKKKNREKVLAGEMILSFLNDGKGCLPLKRSPSKVGIEELVEEAISEIGAEGKPFAGETLFNRVVVDAWNSGALHTLNMTREDFSEILRNRGWEYDKARHQWFNKEKGVPSGYQLTL